MYGDEFAKIKTAIDNYTAADATKKHLQEKRSTLNERRALKTKLQIAFIGWTGNVDVPEAITEQLYEWLDCQLLHCQSELTAFQMQLTCPAATKDRQS